MTLPLSATLLAFAPLFAAPPLALPADPPAVERVGEGVLSTSAHEFNPTLSPDGQTLYFVRGNADFTGQKIMASRWEGGRWGAPERVAFSDERFFDSDLTLSGDGGTMVFASTRPRPDGGGRAEDYDLWRSVRGADGRWGEPSHLGAVNSAAPEFGPELHGGWLLFNSYRAGRDGLSDLYRVRWEGGAPAGAPETLGAVLNSPSHDADPVLSPDGRVLVFVSWDRPGGLGKGDLYVSVRQGEGWSAPESLGAGVNSAGFDFTPFFSPDGEWLYFASDRGGEAADLYRVRVRDVEALRRALEAR